MTGTRGVDPHAEYTRRLQERVGAATRLRLSIETRAKGLARLMVPLLRSRFRKTMEQSLTRIASILE